MFVKFISGFSPRFDVMVDHRPLTFTIAQDMEPMKLKRKLFRLFLSIGIPTLLKGDQ